jgi:hypothetical protein
MNQRATAQGVCRPDMVDPSQIICFCDPGAHQQDGACVPDVINCPKGAHEQGGKCVRDEIQCGSGAILHGNECKPIPGEFKNLGQCIKDSLTQGSKVAKDTCKSAFKNKK